MGTTVVRRGGPADFGPAVEVWHAANEARLEGRASPPPVQVERLQAALRDPASFLFVADDGGISGMAVGMQGLANDGAGPPIGDLCHVGAVFVAPGLWGRGLGGRLVDAVLSEARSRGYGRAQPGRTPTTPAPAASTGAAVSSAPDARKRTTSERPSSTTSASSRGVRRTGRRDAPTENDPTGAGFEPARYAGQRVTPTTRRRG